MRKSNQRSFRSPLATILAAFAVVTIASTAAHATGDPCLSVTLTCQDVAAAGDPIPISGTITNCGQVAFGLANVVNVGYGTIFEGPLGPGESANFSSSYVPDFYPSTDTVIAHGYIHDSSEPQYTLAIANATCGIAPQTDICRTPGFWAEHGGTEKSGAENITLDVIDAVGSLNVCGKTIDRTTILSGSSALEAMCVSPKGVQRLQLARQLTATALNCAISHGDASCDGSNIFGVFGECNDVCAGIGDQTKINSCIDKLDCFNNGGNLMSNGLCQLGSCAGIGVTACDADVDCGVNAAGRPVACVPPTTNCHDRPLVNGDLGLDFPDPGPAGSTDACNSARKNTCTIFSCGGR